MSRPVYHDSSAYYTVPTGMYYNTTSVSWVARLRGVNKPLHGNI